jgi:hypothetical protein
MEDSKMTHDPSEYIRGLQQLLISDKKKIAFLFGAGTSLAKKNTNSKYIPTIVTMTTDIQNELSKKELYKTALTDLKEEIGNEKYNIESLLTLIEQKIHVIGLGKLNGLKKTDFDDLKKEIKGMLKEKVSIHLQVRTELDNVIHLDFADWIGKADRKLPIELFTTNYDYLFELGLENKNIPYYDGFTGTYEPFFNADSVDDLCFLPKQTKLWKMHGSLGWHYDEITKKVWRKDSDSNDMLIYPSTLKYDESRKQPYIALGDRLTNFLKQADSILITCGYSFGDEHINERILTALRSNISAQVFALYYDIVREEDGNKKYSLTEDSTIARISKSQSKFSVYGSRNAIIGCKYGIWKLKKEPDKEDTINVSSYFDEDGPNNLEELKNNEFKGEEKWTGEGELKIPDFKYFVEFLQTMIFIPNDDKGDSK